MKISIGIATAGRRDILADTIAFLAQQLRPADELLICPARPEDVSMDRLSEYGAPVTVIPGPVGLPHQRNVLLKACQGDVLVFFDDDFLPAPNYLAELERLLESDTTIVMATGAVIADGAQGAGFDLAEGRRWLEAALPAVPAQPAVHDTFNGYGCNMAVRMSTVRAHGLWFDEILPLYAWLEDVDFSRQIATYGRIVKAPLLRGVHLGTKKAGRSPGKRLGYSQVANRVYLARKNTLSWGQAWEGMGRNLVANIVHSIRPEPWADRRGRLAGNLLAFVDWGRGQLDPRKITQMK